MLRNGGSNKALAQIMQHYEFVKKRCTISMWQKTGITNWHNREKVSGRQCGK